MKEASKSGTAKAAGRKYAVMDPRTGETYSPKQILRLVIGPGFSFFGGKGLNGANRVFRAFGFPIGKTARLAQERSRLKRRTVRIPNTRQILQGLFSQTWHLLPPTKELRKITHDPGVYVLAYSNERLQGKPVREIEVFYVGMACEGGLSTRLQQFRAGIARGGCHSGADRFYRIWLRRKPYDPRGPSRFYFACVPVNCLAAKSWRTPNDLRGLGKVAELEYAAIARVKTKIHHEPLLNTK